MSDATPATVKRAPRKPKAEPPFEIAWVVVCYREGKPHVFPVSYGPGGRFSQRYMDAFENQDHAEVLRRLSSTDHVFELAQATWRELKQYDEYAGVLFLPGEGVAKFHRFDGKDVTKLG